MASKRKETGLRIVLLNETYSKKMGYAENCLPKALAGLGADVHLIVLPLAPYYYRADFQETYGEFNKVDEGQTRVETIDGFTVHYLEPTWLFGKVRMRGLLRTLRDLAPQVVQTFSVNSWIPIESALYRLFLGYSLFTATSYQASVFPLARRRVPFWHPERVHAFFLRAIPGRFISLVSEKCYGATDDCSDVAVRFFGVQKRKMSTDPFGVDSDVFFPEPCLTRRADLRAMFGFVDDEIVCVYSGRFSPEKNPLILARAVAKLRAQGKPYRALFIGNGEQAVAIEACSGAKTHPFVEFRNLAPLYRASDIGVWPTQESTSMLDAAACGLPLVVNDTLKAAERIEGNGLKYRLGDVDDLARVLLLLESREIRAKLGSAGAAKIANSYSWNSIAKKRFEDYVASLAGDHEQTR